MNAFSLYYKPVLKLVPTPRETQLYAASKSQREKIVLSDAKNGISIPTQAQSDRSKRVAGRRIGL